MENKLYYLQPATTFTEALPLGNGTIGAMVYGDPTKDKISFNHDTLWSGKPRTHLREGAYEAYVKAREAAMQGEVVTAQKILDAGFNWEWSQAFLPMSNLFISCEEEEITDYARELDLENAIVTVTYRAGGVANKREYFVSHPEGCYVSKFMSAKPKDYTITAETGLRYDLVCEGDIIRIDGTAPVRLTPANHLPAGMEQVEYDEGSMTFTCAYKVLSNGEVSASADGIRVKDATWLTVLMNADTSFVAFDKTPDKEHRAGVLAKLESAATKDYAYLRSRHTNDFSSYYNRVRLNLNSPVSTLPTDVRLRECEQGNGIYELLFNFGRYLLISASRPGSRATNLQGIWNENPTPPWQSNYTVNINTEMNYWPVFMCNLAEFNEPLVEFIKVLRESGKPIAKHYYHADGFTAHHNVDIWGMANPTGRDTPGAARYAVWCLSSGWLCRHLFEQYEYTLDKEFLAETAYPIMKEAARFYLDVLVKDTDGKYILSPSTSPENDFRLNGVKNAVAKWTTMSQSIIYNLFKDCLKSAEILGINDDFVREIDETAANMKLFAIGSQGQLMEWDQEYEENDPHHRHVSHLYGLFPGDLFTTESAPELANACAKTLEIRGDNGTGWSLGWKVNLWAKLKDGDHALRMVDMQLRLVETAGTQMKGGGTYPNMFDAHPPFQIDGNFGVTSGIAQFFLQCEDNKLKILPALPAAFASGEIEGLLAKGNITVNIRWADGELKKLVLCSPTTQSVTVSVERGAREYSVTLPAGQRVSIEI